MMELPDRLLLDRFIAARDEAAFRTLVERHLPLVHGVALRTTGGREDLARDAAQETFIGLAKRAALVPPQVDLGAWLHRIARHAAVDQVRSEERRKKRELHAATSPHAAVMTHHPSTSEAAAWSELAPVIDALVDSLPAVDRDLVVARFYRNESHAAIAGRLGVSETLARKRSSRALEKLRALLGRKGIATSSAALATLLPAHAATTPASFPALMTAVTGAVRGVVPLVPSGFTSIHLAMSTAQKSSLAAAAVIFLASAGYSLRPADETAAASPLTPAAAGNAVAAAETRIRRERKLPSTPEERLERLRQILAVPALLDRQREMLAFLDLLSPSQFQETVEHLRELKADPGHDEMQFIFAAWTRADPQAAAGWALRDDSTMPGYSGILRLWGELDPEAALAWAAQHLPDPATAQPTADPPLHGDDSAFSSRAPLIQILSGWAVRDAVEAVKALLRIFPDQTAQALAFKDLAHEMQDQPDGVWRLVAAMPQGPQRSHLMADSIRSFPPQTQLVSSLELILQETGPPDPKLVKDLFQSWSRSDRTAAVARLPQLPPGEVQDNAVRGVCLGEIRGRIPECLELLRQYPTAADDNIIGWIAGQAMLDDVEGGLEELLLMRDEARRDDALAAGLARFWRHNPERIQRWIDTHQVPAGVLQRLKENSPDLLR